MVVRACAVAEKIQPFDFLVGGELLRTSLEKTLLKQNISAVSAYLALSFHLSNSIIARKTDACRKTGRAGA